MRRLFRAFPALKGRGAGEENSRGGKACRRPDSERRLRTRRRYHRLRQKSCDAILSNFREKIETHKSDLAEIQEAVFNFKNELFEKYRLHIELIDQIAPIYEYDELTSDKYVDRMVTNLKREIAAEYDLRLDDILSEEEKNAELLDKVDDMAEKLKDDDRDASDKPEKSPEPDVKTAKKGGHRRKSVVPSVIELLDECEDAAKDEAVNFGKQLKLDVDALLAGTKNEK